MFDIEFLAEPPAREDEQQHDTKMLQGRVTLGDFTETFFTSLEEWTREDYQRHWLEAARRLLGGADRTGFFTEAMWRWWTMWLEGQDVIVQEQILVPDALLEPLDPQRPYRQIGERSSLSEDGAPISEWNLTLGDIEAFVDRRAAEYGSKPSSSKP